MKLVPNAGRIALWSFSMWGYYLSLLVLIVPEVLYAVGGIEVSPYVIWVLATCVAVVGMIGRVWDQGLSE
ncbi:MAG: hypothetical protein ABJO67_16280 [Pseudoruegeria sp.]